MTVGATSTHSGSATRGLVLVCLVGIIWGTIGPAVALVAEASDLTPATITAHRCLLAVAVLWIGAVATHQVGAAAALVREDPRRVIGVGALTGSYQLLFFLAVVLAGVSISTVVALGLAPTLLLLSENVRRRRPPPAADALTVGTALAGLVLVAVVGESGPRPDHLWFGIAAALGAGAAYALATDLSAPLSQGRGAIAVTVSTMSVGLLLLVPLGAISAAATGTALIPRSSTEWLLIAYLGIVTMALAYALLFAGLRTTPSSSAVVATLLEPVTAVLIAVAFLGERLTSAGLVGSALIILAIASLGWRRVPAPQ